MSWALGVHIDFPLVYCPYHDSLSLPKRPALFQWSFPPALIHLIVNRVLLSVFVSLFVQCVSLFGVSLHCVVAASCA